MKSLFLVFLKFIATLASSSSKQKKLFILIYHRVLDEPDFMLSREIDKKAFTWQMALLSRYFNVLPLGEALEKLDKNELPSRAVCITFDDGYADNYTNALPILENFGLHATFFIANGFLNGGIMWNDRVIEGIRHLNSEVIDLQGFNLGCFETDNTDKKRQAAFQIISKIKHMDMNERLKIANYISSQVENMPTDLMLTDQQLTSLHKAGMEIGGHTVTHPILAKLDKQSTETELTENKSKLEKLLNTKIRFFAYPNGKPQLDYNLEQVEQVKSIGYQAALSTQWGVANIGSDRYQLPRFTPWDTKPTKFMLRMIHRYYSG